MNNVIRVHRAEYTDVAAMRELYRHEAHCQIVRGSILRRGLADPYLFLVNEQRAGYGGVWNRHWPGRIMEFYVLPPLRAQDASLPSRIGRAFVQASGATHIEAQTNLPVLLALLLDVTSASGIAGDGQTSSLIVENLLFADAGPAHLLPVLKPGLPCLFRPLTNGEAERVFVHHREPVGAWGVEGDADDGAGKRILATGGYLTHYNLPYADVFMEVDAAARRQGVGAYLVQELKRVCCEAGYLPAARCNVDNIASQRTLQRAGFTICGQILSGAVQCSNGGVAANE